MVSQELNSHRRILRQPLQGAMVHIPQLNLVMPSNRLPIIQHTGTKGPLIRLLTVLPKLNQLILLLLLDSRVMLNPLRLSQPMISLPAMGMCLQQLVMGRARRPSLHTRNMTPVRCMAHIVESRLAVVCLLTCSRVAVMLLVFKLVIS